MRESTNGPWNPIYDTALPRGEKSAAISHRDRKVSPRFTRRVPNVWRFNGSCWSVHLWGLHNLTFLPGCESISAAGWIYVRDVILMLTQETVKYMLTLGGDHRTACTNILYTVNMFTSLYLYLHYSALPLFSRVVFEDIFSDDTGTTEGIAPYTFFMLCSNKFNTFIRIFWQTFVRCIWEMPCELILISIYKLNTSSSSRELHLQLLPEHQ